MSSPSPVHALRTSIPAISGRRFRTHVVGAQGVESGICTPALSGDEKGEHGEMYRRSGAPI